MEVMKMVQTGSAAAGITYSFTVDALDGNLAIGSLFVKFSGSVTPTVTVTLDSVDGAAYDTLLKTQTLGAGDDFAWAPEGDFIFGKGDIVKITISAVVSTYGLTLKMKKL